MFLPPRSVATLWSAFLLSSILAGKASSPSRTLSNVKEFYEYMSNLQDYKHHTAY